MKNRAERRRILFGKREAPAQTQSSVQTPPPAPKPFFKHRAVHMPLSTGNGPDWNCYSSAEDCPFTVFRDCQTKGDFRALATYGEPPLYDLQVVFLKIYSQYCEIAQETAAISRFLSVAQITALECRITAITALIQVLFDCPSAPLIQSLADWGYKVAFDPQNPTAVFPALKRIEGSLKTEYVRLRSLKSEVDILEEEGKEARRPDSAHFDQILIGLSSVAGYMIRAEDLNVQQYGLRIAQAKSLKKTDK